MKSLADFKRRLTPGTLVTAEFPGMTINGNLNQTVLPGRTTKRKVHSVSSSMIVWEDEKQPGKSGSRLDWPKASCLSFVDANTVAVSDEPGGKAFVTYRFDA